MNTLAWIIGIVLMAMFSMSAMVKITDHKMAVEIRGRLGIAKTQYQLIGVAEAFGLLVFSWAWSEMARASNGPARPLRRA